MWCFRIRITMHASLNTDVIVYVSDTIAALHSAQWQDLELVQPAFTTRKKPRQRKEELRMRHLDSRKYSYVHVWDPWKLHVSINESAQAIVSWLLPSFKGLYDMHIRRPFPSHTGMQNPICALRIRTQTVIDGFFVQGNCNTHACLTRWWNLFYFDGHHL